MNGQKIDILNGTTVDVLSDWKEDDSRPSMGRPVPDNRLSFLPSEQGSIARQLNQSNAPDDIAPVPVETVEPHVSYGQFEQEFPQQPYQQYQEQYPHHQQYQEQYQDQYQDQYQYDPQQYQEYQYQPQRNSQIYVMYPPQVEPVESRVEQDQDKKIQLLNAPLSQSPVPIPVTEYQVLNQKDLQQQYHLHDSPDRSQKPNVQLLGSQTTLGATKTEKPKKSRKKLLFWLLLLLLVLVGAALGIYFGLVKKESNGSPSTSVPSTSPRPTSDPARPVPVPTRVATFVGSGTKETRDGTGLSASFNEPIGIVRDGSGTLYVSEPGSNLIRRISVSGVVTTFAGSGTEGNGNGLGTSASFRFPVGLAIDKSNNLFVADRANNVIRRITASGTVSSFAGSGSKGNSEGQGLSASFDEPNGLAFDSQGNLYVVEYSSHRIRRISPSGAVTNFAGNGATGSGDGFGTTASFHFPAGIVIDSQDNIYVSDSYNHAIRKITTAGLVSTFVGTGTSGRRDGRGTSASFFYPGGLAVDQFDNLYVADYGNNMIRRVTVDGVVTTLAGNGSGGRSDGTGSSATFDAPNGIAVDADGSLYITDQRNNIIRKISPN